MQQKTIQQYREKYPATRPTGAAYAAIEKFSAPKGYSDSYDHFRNFFTSVRSRQQPVEDATFGFRAAGAALLSNLSVEKGQDRKVESRDNEARFDIAASSTCHPIPVVSETPFAQHRRIPIVSRDSVTADYPKFDYNLRHETRPAAFLVLHSQPSRKPASRRSPTTMSLRCREPECLSRRSFSPFRTRL